MNKQIKNELITILVDLLEEKHIEYDDINMFLPLSEEGIGLDSTSRLVFMGKIEEYFNIEISEVYWGNKSFNNLNEIYQILLLQKGVENFGGF